MQSISTSDKQRQPKFVTQAGTIYKIACGLQYGEKLEHEQGTIETNHNRTITYLLSIRLTRAAYFYLLFQHVLKVVRRSSCPWKGRGHAATRYA